MPRILFGPIGERSHRTYSPPVPCRATTTLLLLTVLVLAACSGGDDTERHRRLARGFVPRSLPQARVEWVAPFGASKALHLSPSDDPYGLWVECPVGSDTWRRKPGTGTWRAPRPMPGVGGPSDGSPQVRLSDERGDYRYVPAIDAMDDPAAVEPRSFTIVGDSLWAMPADPEQAPADATLFEYVGLGRQEEGSWRFGLDRFFGDALTVLPGFSEQVRLDVPSESALRVRTTTRAWSSAPEGTAGEVTFRIFAGEELLFEHAQPIGIRVRSEAHVVSVPAGSGSILRFEVAGDAALSAFHTPVLGPRQVGDYRVRPWNDERPDVIVFLADTFRADNMALYGGDPALTPNLDRFAAECLRFERVWSSSTWTLPSHATLFSGLFPYQSGVVTDTDRLGQDAITLAEQLQAAGYRTGAVTDHAFVSSTFGLAQGFEWFDEQWLDLDDTLEGTRRFLDADDGRPVFLFVHTYRVHVPYRVSPETQARLGEHLGLTEDWDALEGSDLDLSYRNDPNYAPNAEVLAARRAYEALYRGAAADLDAGFQRLRDQLARLGLDQGTVFVFTSDHGEGFWEHGHAGHGNGLWEEHIRIPLLVSAPNVEPGSVPFSAGLIDLPRTLAALTGTSPAPSWRGTNLVELDGERTSLSFQCLRWGGPSSVAIGQGPRKVVTLASKAELPKASAQLAYDLERDPGETTDLASEAWAGDLLRAKESQLSELLEPVLDADSVRLDSQAREQMRALGYFGEE